jgi:cell division protein FtsW
MLPFLSARQQLLLSASLLLITGFLLVTSASIHFADTRLGNPFHFSFRHGMFVLFAVAVGIAISRVKVETWQARGPLWLLLSVVGLVLVLAFGIEVNGSKRWLPGPGFNIQPSEFAKIGLLLFIADFLARRRDEIDQWRTLVIKLGGAFGLVILLLLLEPDFGASVVIVSMVFAVLFLAGLSWKWVVGLIVLGGLCVVGLVLTQPYRVARLTSYLDPWQHQFDTGYQLVQSLIAFGRGEIGGVGLGNSVQKLFYLPEAHTDFVFAVAAEEFGLLGVLFIVTLFVLLVGAMLRIARERAEAGDAFGAYVGWGAAVLFGVQSFINMSVNMGLLPTKGLTLPLVSYGGSSLVACCALLGILWQLASVSSGATKKPLRVPRQVVRA